ncbi:MAG: hypothetical protein ABSH22_12900 [Tepidisphaeraceae bacterium]
MRDSFATPTRVVPVTTTVNGVAADFGYTFARHSKTVLRLGTK